MKGIKRRYLLCVILLRKIRYCTCTWWRNVLTMLWRRSVMWSMGGAVHQNTRKLIGVIHIRLLSTNLVLASTTNAWSMCMWPMIGEHMTTLSTTLHYLKTFLWGCLSSTQSHRALTGWMNYACRSFKPRHGVATPGWQWGVSTLLWYMYDI